MDIAYVSGFESQEAFTRAFKKQYGLPPGRYRNLMNMIQGGGSQMENASTIKKWFLAGSEPDQYEVGLDQQEVHQGKQSAYLRSKSVNETAHLKLQSLEGTVQFGTLMQQCKAANYTGKRIKLSGFIRTEKVHISAGLWMRVDSKDGDVLQFDNMSNRTITGDTGWNVYSIVLDIPSEASAIAFGVLLSGTGSVWLDSLSFQEVDDRTPTTNLEIDFELHEEPMNLSFEME
ncbi:AraC family transcriptional regulator [Bacillus sp. JCM 19041]|uniref:helix-turn-helix domain-containing protein n=1 Tax=Bacillus sp. JCM 19041 TaxID=1460637 RepID=UPI000B1D716C